MQSSREGNCYATSEAIYHLLGGKKSGLKAMRLPIKGEDQNHWFLEHESGLRIDLTASQFDEPLDYSKAVPCGFRGALPSHAARLMIDQLIWASE